MKLSQDTLEALKALDISSGDTLRKKNDMGAILEIGAGHGLHELVNEIIFFGAATWNLAQTLKKAPPAEGANQKIESQLKESIAELREYLAEIAALGDEEIQKRFVDIYLKTTPGTFKNLIDLSYDLSKMKSLQVVMKRKSGKPGP